MNFLKQLFFSVNRVLFLWVASLIFVIITFFLVFYKIDSREPSVILHYNVITGVDLFGSKTNLYKIPATGLFIIVINFFISQKIKRDKEFLSFLGALLTFIMCLTLLSATLLLLKVN